MDKEKFRAAIKAIEAYLNSEEVGRKSLSYVSDIETHIQTLRDIASPNVHLRIASLLSRARSLFDGSKPKGHSIQELRRQALEDLYVIESDGERCETGTES